MLVYLPENAAFAVNEGMDRTHGQESEEGEIGSHKRETLSRGGRTSPARSAGRTARSRKSTRSAGRCQLTAGGRPRRRSRRATEIRATDSSQTSGDELSGGVKNRLVTTSWQNALNARLHGRCDCGGDAGGFCSAAVGSAGDAEAVMPCLRERGLVCSADWRDSIALSAAEATIVRVPNW